MIRIWRDIVDQSGRLVPLALLAVFFALSRVVFWRMGVRYDASSLDNFWQYLDVHVLQDRLLPGLFHLHSQPPAFNLFLGIVVKLFSVSPISFHYIYTAFHLIYMAVGFVLYTSLVAFLRLSHFSRITSFLFASAFVISPSAILYENWLFYTYPVAALLMLAALALLYFERSHSFIGAAAFVFLLMLVCLTRSAFHLVYLLGAVPFVLAPRSKWRKAIGLCAACCVSVVLIVYVKNWLVFGSFGASSLGGMNLARVAQHAIGTDAIAQMVASGDVAEIAGMDPFKPLDVYLEHLRGHEVSPREDVPELFERTKTSGSPNFNHPAYIFLSKEYSDAGIRMIRMRPRYYISGVFDAWLIYCKPSWQYLFLKANSRALSDYISLLSTWRLRFWVDLQPLKSALRGESGPPLLFPLTGFLIPVVLLLAATETGVMISRAWRKGGAVSLSYVFMTFTVLYLAILGNAMEYGENNRFRVMTDPLIFLLAILSCRMVLVQANRVLRRTRCQQSPAGDVRKAAPEEVHVIAAGAAKRDLSRQARESEKAG